MFKEYFWSILDRLKILRYYRKNKTHVRLKEILKFIFSPTYSMRAKKFIAKIKENGDYYKVYIKNEVLPLFWPKSLSLHDLYQVVVELKDKNHWHYYEIPDTAVKSGDTVIDCGAAEGLFSLTVLERANKIYLIEPLPVFYSSLQKTFENIEKCEIIPYAIGSEIGEIYINNLSIASKINHNKGFKVKLETIDNLFYNNGIKVNYIKADLEGYEMHMLKGAVNTIKQNKPKIVLATYHEGEIPNEIKSFILSLVPEYNHKIKGIYEQNGKPITIHFWI